MGRFPSSVQYWPSLPLKVGNEGAETILLGNLFHILNVRSIKKFELILDLGGFSVGGNNVGVYFGGHPQIWGSPPKIQILVTYFGGALSIWGCPPKIESSNLL